MKKRLVVLVFVLILSIAVIAIAQQSLSITTTIPPSNITVEPEKVVPLTAIKSIPGASINATNVVYGNRSWDVINDSDSDTAANTIECPAAPAIAAKLLKENEVSPRYGKGGNGGNYISDVAHEMGSHPGDQYGSWFRGNDKCVAPGLIL